MRSERATPEDIKRLREERKRLKAEYATLFNTLSEILFRNDPVGINFGFNTDEYEAETGSILPRLRDCVSLADVKKVVYREFLHWFGDSAGPESKYDVIAEQVWEMWQKYAAGNP
jgi:hypothetical protein